MNYFLFLVFFMLLSLGGMFYGIYMIYSGVTKGKGIILPKRDYVPFFHNLKEGQEWLLVIIGIVWSLVMFAMFLAGVAAIFEVL